MVRAAGGFKEDFPDKIDLNSSSQEESSSRKLTGDEASKQTDNFSTTLFPHWP